MGKKKGNEFYVVESDEHGGDMTETPSTDPVVYRRVLPHAEWRRLCPKPGQRVRGYGIVQMVDKTGLVVVIREDGSSVVLDALDGMKEV